MENYVADLLKRELSMLKWKTFNIKFPSFFEPTSTMFSTWLDMVLGAGARDLMLALL